MKKWILIPMEMASPAQLGRMSVATEFEAAGPRARLESHQTQIKSSLKAKGKDSAWKRARFNQAYADMQGFKEAELDQPRWEPPKGAPPPVTPPPSPQVVSTIRRQITNTPELTVNGKEEVSIKGKRLPSSNVNDIVNSLASGNTNSIGASEVENFLTPTSSRVNRKGKVLKPSPRPRRSQKKPDRFAEQSNYKSMFK